MIFTNWWDDPCPNDTGARAKAPTTVPPVGRLGSADESEAYSRPESREGARASPAPRSQAEAASPDSSSRPLDLRTPFEREIDESCVIPFAQIFEPPRRRLCPCGVVFHGYGTYCVLCAFDNLHAPR